jgi:hypothetical protein
LVVELVEVGRFREMRGRGGGAGAFTAARWGGEGARERGMAPGRVGAVGHGRRKEAAGGRGSTCGGARLSVRRGRREGGWAGEIEWVERND